MQCLQLTRGGPPVAPLKWNFNQTITLPEKGTKWTIDFVLGNSSTSYYNLKVKLINDVPNLCGAYYIDMMGQQVSQDKTLYNDKAGWSNSSYRTIIFDTPPTGTLLSWLKDNATPK